MAKKGFFTVFIFSDEEASAMRKAVGEVEGFSIDLLEVIEPESAAKVQEGGGDKGYVVSVEAEASEAHLGWFELGGWYDLYMRGGDGVA